MMTTIQERLQRKREPLDKWSTREQLCLAFSVARSGDQNWMSVSRALKQFGHPNRPADWFHQKNCAAQYGALLENVETPKRKKRISGTESVIETASECILRRLISERKMELKKLMEEERTEYLKLQEEMVLLKSGNITEEQLDQMCKQIDEEEAQKEKEALAHAQWLRERELRKQELERVWRPIVKTNASPLAIGQKRKASDSIESLLDIDHGEDQRITPPEPSKPTLSPLLTSLLKSPSHAQSVATSSILHSAITSVRPIISSNNMNSSNSAIANLLNSNNMVKVSPGLQHLVSTAISQEPVMKETITDLLDGADQLPNLKPEDIESSILSADEPLPEIKNEEVDVIISDLIENADIVTDPEQHLLDSNDGIIDFEHQLEELVNKEKDVAAEVAAAEEEQKQQQQQQQQVIMEKPKEEEIIDPFEFQEDPEIYQQPTKLSNLKNSSDSSRGIQQHQPHPQQVSIVHEIAESFKSIELPIEEKEIKQEVVEEVEKVKEQPLPGSVEIVEVVVMEDEDISKELNKSQIQDIVHSTIKTDIKEEDLKEDTVEVVKEDENKTEVESISEGTSESLDSVIKTETSEELKEATTDGDESSSRRNTFTPEFAEDLFDDLNIEVTKLDKIGKAKRDYSRTKKKEESDFDILLAVEQAVQMDEESESLSEKDDINSKIAKIKVENERSNSPWTEEEEISNIRNTRRRYSTPATPVDSVPNSPASSSYFEDDRDYRNWKKSIMLVYSRLTTHKYASLFLKPITNEHAPGYHNIVRRPMDLQTLRKNIESGVIKTTAEFQRDVLLMFNNAIMYNKTNDTVYRMAFEMQQEGVEQIKILVLAQQADLPARRETRTSEGPGSKRKRGNEDNLKSKKKKED